MRPLRQAIFRLCHPYLWRDRRRTARRTRHRLAQACPPTHWYSRHRRPSSSQSSQGRHGLTPGLCLLILSLGEPMVVVGARKAMP